MNIEIILRRAIEADGPTLAGWELATLEHLEEAVLYRLARLANRGFFDRHFEHKEIISLQNAVGSPKPRFTFSGDHSECAFLLFSDGSLYWANNADDEVWKFADDFITERIMERGNRDANDFAADSDAGKLIRQATPHFLA